MPPSPTATPGPIQGRGEEPSTHLGICPTPLFFSKPFETPCASSMTFVRCPHLQAFCILVTSPPSTLEARARSPAKELGPSSSTISWAPEVDMSGKYRCKYRSRHGTFGPALRRVEETSLAMISSVASPEEGPTRLGPCTSPQPYDVTLNAPTDFYNFQTCSLQTMSQVRCPQ